MATKNRVTAPNSTAHYQRCVLIRYLQHSSIIWGGMVNLLGAAQNIEPENVPASKSATKVIAEGEWQTMGYPGKKVH